MYGYKLSIVNSDSYLFISNYRHKINKMFTAPIGYGYNDPGHLCFHWLDVVNKYSKTLFKSNEQNIAVCMNSQIFLHTYKQSAIHNGQN